jgi:phosphoglycerate dehydrogenase-like enzyme
MKKQHKICVTSPSFSKNEILRKELTALFPNSVFNEDGKKYNSEELIEYLNDADGVILGLENMDSKVISALPDLQIISKYGVGLDNLDVEFAKSVGKKIGWTGGVNKQSAAEQALGLMLGICRNLYLSGYKLKQGVWDKNGGVQLAGKTVGIVGCGHVGSQVIRLLQPFGCEILINDILDKSEFAKKQGAVQVDFETIVKKADIISFHVPLTNLTHYMVNETQLNKMKSSAFVISNSRGPVVEQKALHQALIKKQIAGAALDVFEEEPPTDLEFLSLPNLIVTPHIGGNAKEAIEAMGRSAIKHLKDYFYGK